ncbi:MAG: hypothetical protein LBS62_03750, partial [Clostridiales bacterium]|nr:hypothetical protein [Clostridiales bacterium]
MSNFCKSRDAQLNPEAKFRGSRGTKTRQAQNPSGKAAHTEPADAPLSAGKNRKKLWGLIAASVLVIALGFGILARAIGEEMKSKTLSEGVLGAENLVLSGKGVSMALSLVTLDTEAPAKIARVEGAPPLDEDSGIELTVYDFSLEDAGELAGVIDLTIPLELKQGEVPGAAYLNEETGQWEPVAFRSDSAAGAVVISTDHLSKYGVFSISGAGTRNARAEFLTLGGGAAADENLMAAVEEYIAFGMPASECLNIGINAVGDSLQIGGDILGGLAQSAGYLAYGEDVLSAAGDYLGNIGLMTSVVQIGINAAEGKIHEALVGSMKTAWSYTMGKAASKLGGSLMSAGMAAVAIVDYSINKFGTEAIEGRASIYRDAYNLYYQKNERGYKSSAYWYQILYPLFEAGNLSEEELKAEIDSIITAHCREFWSGDNVDGVDAYVDMAREKLTWTGGGAGLNDTLRDEISAERRAVLYNDVIPGVIYQIARKINLENERKLLAEYRALSNYLNTTVAFSLTDVNKTYAGHTIRFAPLGGKADVKNWTGKISGSGTANTSFTLYGHVSAGAPNTLEICAPGSDVPVKTVSFKVTLPKIEIALEDEAPSPTPAAEGSGYAEPTDEPAPSVTEQKYAWVLVDTVHRDMRHDIDHTNKGGVYEKSASASPGSYTYSQKYIGESDKWYDPDMLHGESYATQLTFAVPPEVIRGGETVTLSFSLTFTDNNLSFFDGHGDARADWGNLRFTNADGKKFFEIYSSVKYSEKNVLAVSDTLSAVIPAGYSEGEQKSCGQ